MKFQTIEQALAWMNDQHKSAEAISVEKVGHALNYLGNPHQGLPVIHITGTNGKGSTTAFLRDLLQSQGLKVATYTSPHIMKFNERISYNGQNISDEELVEVLNKMVEVNEYMASTPFGRLVFFELYTVMAAYYFAKKQPDVCLIEVGIGGYTDATIHFDGQLAVITTIGLDHADKFGDKIENVAYEKAGIIKDHAQVVTGRIAPDLLQIIKQKVKKEEAVLSAFDHDYQIEKLENVQELGSRFTWANDSYRENFHIQMLGYHQVDNAAVALQAFSLWMDQIQGQNIDWIAASHRLETTQWLARMEKVHQNPLVYIDGAHNTAGLNALRQTMDEYFVDYDYTIIYAGLSTKNQAEQLPLLMNFPARDIFLTEFGHEKAMTAQDYQEIEQHELDTFPKLVDWQAYLSDYLGRPAEAKHLLLLTGSLYFVSDAREFIVNQNR